jgi:hypothetical protein
LPFNRGTRYPVPLAPTKMLVAISVHPPPYHRPLRSPSAPLIRCRRHSMKQSLFHSLPHEATLPYALYSLYHRSSSPHAIHCLWAVLPAACAAVACLALTPREGPVLKPSSSVSSSYSDACQAAVKGVTSAGHPWLLSRPIVATKLFAQASRSPASRPTPPMISSLA